MQARILAHHLRYTVSSQSFSAREPDFTQISDSDTVCNILQLILVTGCCWHFWEFRVWMFFHGRRHHPRSPSRRPFEGFVPSEPSKTTVRSLTPDLSIFKNERMMQLRILDSYSQDGRFMIFMSVFSGTNTEGWGNWTASSPSAWIDPRLPSFLGGGQVHNSGISSASSTDFGAVIRIL